MGSSFEVLYEDDLRKFFDLQKYEPQVERINFGRVGIHEAICKSFINGLEINGSKITNIFEDKIYDIYDLNIGEYVISNFNTFNEFSKNDKAVEFFHDFLKDERFEKIDDMLYQIAEYRFDWFTEMENYLYGSKVYNIDASLPMSSPVSSKQELNYENEEKYLPQKILIENLSQINTVYKQFSLELRSMINEIYGRPFDKNYFDILLNKVHSYRIKLRDILIKIPILFSIYELRKYDYAFQMRIIIMAKFIEDQKKEFPFSKKNKKWSKLDFVIRLYDFITAMSEDYLVLSNRLQSILYDDMFDKPTKLNKFESLFYSEKRMYNTSISSSYNNERPRRNQLNGNFFNYFKTPELNISFYGNAFGNKFLVNRVHHHKKNIDAVKSAFDGILND